MIQSLWDLLPWDVTAFDPMFTLWMLVCIGVAVFFGATVLYRWLWNG